MKTETCKLYFRAFWIFFAKCHQNRSSQFRAMRFQSWCIFSETQCIALLLIDQLFVCVCPTVS